MPTLAISSPVESRLFEDVAGVSGNRCIKHGSSSTLIDWQTTVGVFFQDPDISKNMFRFSASPAINDTLSAYRPTSGTGSLNSVEIRAPFQRYSRASGSECDWQEIAPSWEKSGRRPQSHFPSEGIRSARAKFG